MTTTQSSHIETPAEEDARFVREAEAFDAEVARRVAALENEGVGDGLHGTLTVLLDPKTANYSEEERRADIVTTVLRTIAKRDIAREAASS